jgi:hypothetical protein
MIKIYFDNHELETGVADPDSDQGEDPDPYSYPDPRLQKFTY